MLHKNYLPPYPNPNPNLAHNSFTECLWVKCTVTLNQFSGTNRGQGLTIADLHVVLIPTIYSPLLAQSVLYFTHKKLSMVCLQWSWTIFLDLRSRSYWNSLENPCLDHILFAFDPFLLIFHIPGNETIFSQWLKWYQIALKSSFEPYFLSLQPNLTQTLW